MNLIHWEKMVILGLGFSGRSKPLKSFYFSQPQCSKWWLKARLKYFQKLHSWSYQTINYLYCHCGRSVVRKFYIARFLWYRYCWGEEFSQKEWFLCFVFFKSLIVACNMQRWERCRFYWRVASGTIIIIATAPKFWKDIMDLSIKVRTRDTAVYKCS